MAFSRLDGGPVSVPIGIPTPMRLRGRVLEFRVRVASEGWGQGRVLPCFPPLPFSPHHSFLLSLGFKVVFNGVASRVFDKVLRVLGFRV